MTYHLSFSIPNNQTIEGLPTGEAPEATADVCGETKHEAFKSIWYTLINNPGYSLYSAEDLITDVMENVESEDFTPEDSNLLTWLQSVADVDPSILISCDEWRSR